LLVVDDDVKIAGAVKRGLEGQGFTVDVARDGDDGWWMATEVAYDLIVLDLALPGRDGFTICRDLRAAENWTPVLMLTANDDQMDEAKALDLGADDYVTKPFSFSVLLARVRSILRRRVHADSAPTVVGDLRLGSAARRVWVGEDEVKLTTREFDVLEFLVRRAGQAVSKDQILRGVWEFDFMGDPNIVQVYLTRIRRKLELAGAADIIHTLHGVGYRIDGN